MMKGSAMEKIAGQMPEGNEHSELQSAAKEIEGDGRALRRAANDLYAEGFGMKELSAVAVSYEAYYMYRKYTLSGDKEKYAKAEGLAKDAIRIEPFKPDGYEALNSIYVREGHYSEAIEAFKGYDASLSKINSDKSGDIFELRQKIGNYIKYAENELNKKP